MKYKTKIRVLRYRSKEQVIKLESGWYRAKGVPALIAGMPFFLITRITWEENL
ncbi:hypothetical protein LCR01_05590 [Companilactobacillus crustorum]|uniref:Uncharacterized protein n=1 Tax=Companilactobacillus crustorum TaxID=392416 RepID=A0AB34A934_9LACO|nr:hypothetical protein LCR01_05590 [Companilactobacillus crustorum]